MPAALLMATLRAYLRGQTIRGQSDLAAMIGNLDRLVYESSAPNRYATFFYGEYDAATRTLRYVNAGHNPPVLVRSSGEIVRLATGGPVVGLLPECHYQQGCTTLQPGDVLVGFTDGVSEAMDAQMREWGEDQLVTEIEANRSLPPKTLIDYIIRRADAFAAGAPQYDDMTLVVIRACE
jgi:sigma-B regulation protein RsbU (phosphoserine phosphatase)